VDEAGRVERNNSAVRSFYTVSEAATVLGVGQRRILEMLETKEIEGERDPVSSRWKIPTHAVHELAPEETPDTEEPTLASQTPREDPTAERSSERSAEEIRDRIDELERLNERLRLEQQAEKTAWQEEKGSLLAAADRERRHAEELQEEVERLSAELGIERRKRAWQRLFR
jgi:excisionase family DNA binding protein